MRNFFFLLRIISFVIFSGCISNEKQSSVDGIPGATGIPEIQAMNETKPEKEDGIREAMMQEFENTKDVSLGYIPLDRLIRANEQLRLARRNGTYASRVNALSWVERGSDSDAVGPYGNPRLGNSVTSGRMRALWVDLADPTNRTVWVGGVDGGIWSTTNITASPANWILSNDFVGNLAVSSICQDPTNTNTMYFSTGEKSPNVDAVHGGGVWKSTDHGITWNLLPSTTSLSNISKIVCDASGNVYIGCMVSISTARGTNGLFRSLNGGTTWTNITPTGLDAKISELEISSTGRMHVACGYYLSPPEAIPGYRYTDNPATVTSATWTSPVVSFTNFQVNIDIAVAGNTLYALPADYSNQTSQVWKSTNGGANWAITVTTPPVTGSAALSSGQAWYNLAIGVDPTNPNNVMVGGLNSYLSTNGGATWNLNSVWAGGIAGSSNYVHADHQIIVWNNNQVLDGGDGGIFYSADDGASFADRNVGLRLKQFYSVAVHPDITNYFLAGAQDNGVHQFNNAGLGSSIEVTGGDGGFVHIDQDEPNFQWGSYIKNNFRRSTDGGASWTSINYSNTGDFINPSDYDDIGNKMYSTYLSGDYLRWDNPQTGSTFAVVTVPALNISEIKSVKVSPYTPNRVYFGTAAGRIVRVDNANTGSPTGTNITGTGMNTRAVSCVAVGTTDNNLLATFSNYGSIHVWVTTVGGGAAGWTNITGTGLPDIPVRWAMFHPEDNTKAILATEMGIYETDLINGASTVWVQNSTFPVVRTDMLQYRSDDGLIAAATHGRGLWTATLPFANPYVRFAFNYNSQLEATTGLSGCRGYKDYTVNMKIDKAPVGDANLILNIAGGSTATQGVDFDFTTNGNFTTPSTALSFASGTTTPQTVTIRVYDDAQIESQESFTLNYNIGGGTTAIAAPSSTSYTFTIVEDDVVPASPYTGAFTVGINNSPTALPTPFRSDESKFRMQSLYTAAELQAAGINTAANIVSITMRVTAKNSTKPYTGFTISMANTTATNLWIGTITSGFTQVFSDNYSSVMGDNTFTFTTPFAWDGISNVVVNICFDNEPNSPDALADVTEATISPLGSGIYATSTSLPNFGVPGCSLTAGLIWESRVTATFAVLGGSQIETVLNSSRSEFLSNSGTYYFFMPNGNVLTILNAASANLGCVNTTILGAGNLWQTFVGGQRSQKVFDVTPTTNPGASYTIGLYFTNAELAGKPPASLRIAKTTAATMAGANSGNTIIATTTVIAFGSGYLFTAPFTGFSKFFLVDAGVALPVDLVSFSGSLDNQSHSALQWQTTNQYNLSNFEVQRSYDGAQFSTIATVNAIQNPASLQGYTFRDPIIAKAINFYRLKMVDQDGRFKYSAIVRINSNKPVKFVALLQNPVKDNISFLLSNPEKAKVSAQLFSSSGQLIRKWDLGSIEGNVVLPFNNTVIASGVYTLRVAAGSKQENLQISKQ